MEWYKKESLIKFESPCTMTLISASNGGKTTFVKKLLENSKGMFKEDFSKVVYCYGSTWQPLFDEMIDKITNISFRESIPSSEEIEMITKNEPHTCLILDDLMMELNSSSKAEKIWTVHSHHCRMSVINLAHNLFQKGPSSRTVSLNTNIYILFRALRDSLQMQTFARQIYPNKTQFFMSAYHKATQESFGYLVVDLNAFSDDKYRLRTHIFPNEDTIVYQPDR